MDVVEVPLQVTSHGFVIGIDVGGEQDLPFVLDTGSTGTSIDDDLAQRLEITSRR